MVTLSKAINASQAQKYHKEEFENKKSNTYYTEGVTVLGEWQGQLAARWGIVGEVRAEQFARLSEGQHPLTSMQLVQHRTKYEYVNERGDTVQPVEHRAGWDATFSAPKSVSVTAIVGGDERVREAHRESVRIALDEMEKYVQARMSNAPAETTGAWVIAKFEHDSSRPVEGYSAPQLHTHAFVFNVTETVDGQTRSLQPRELYRSQQYATAVYRAELAVRLLGLGYEIERGKHAQPEIVGYTADYLRAASPRRQQIEEDLKEKGFTGARAAQIAAHQTRENKQTLPREQVLEQHQRMAQLYGNQPHQVVAVAALRPGVEIQPKRARLAAQEAMAQARESNMERAAVVDERAFMRDALRHSMGLARLSEVHAEFEQSIAEGKLIEVQRAPGLVGGRYTTPEMQNLEREVIERMRAGRDNHEVLVCGESRELAAARHPDLSESQRQAVDHVLTSRDKMTGLDGIAGAGKTTSLEAIHEAAIHAGYEVQGFAPTARAARNLAEVKMLANENMKAETLQMHLARGEYTDGGQKRLYVVDESSMISTVQMHTFLARLKANERVLFLGDVRQHEAVDAGRPYAQLQEAGMRTARIDEIIRQKDPALRRVVEQLARGEVKEAIAQLNTQGRVHEVEDYEMRIRAITGAYMQQPEGTLVVSPDNQSRRELNEYIHRAMQDAGLVWSQEYMMHVLHQRQDLTAADRLFAQNYEHGDVLRYQKSSKANGIKAGQYVRVERVNAENNTLTVKRNNGEDLTYDPRRLQGVQVYRERECAFAEGDRVQFTAPYHVQKLANRELGTIEQMDTDGNLKLNMDSGREVTFNAKQHPHLDYGYAVTSHSSQGQTTDRVLIHVDSELAPGPLLNERFAYVAISRARHDAHIFTNDASTLGYELSRDVSKSSALQQEQAEHRASPSEMMEEFMTQLSMEIGR